MRILIQSPSFSPNIGGVESVARQLAHEFAASGHEVRVITETVSSTAHDSMLQDFGVIRTRRLSQLWHHLRWSEAYLQMGLSIKGLPPLLSFGTRWVVSHHTWYTPASAPLNRLKRFLMRFATNAFCSQAVAEELGVPGKVVGNPYQPTLFHAAPDVLRYPNSLIFVGRLVSDKGVDILLGALKMLHDRGTKVRLTIVGDGPERSALEKQARSLELHSFVTFTGALSSQATAGCLQKAEILVVPSRWQEPFGIVALEGIACGCVVVGSSGGGLRDAIGPCGLTFPNGDVTALADRIHELLTNRQKMAQISTAAPAHLSLHQPAAVANRYLHLMGAASPLQA